ncbi:MAG: hypothetical protein U1E76_05875 [Planctomycetota bacterium]
MMLGAGSAGVLAAETDGIVGQQKTATIARTASTITIGCFMPRIAYPHPASKALSMTV